MAAIAVSPFVMKDVTLLIAADNYEAHVSAVEIVPTAPTVVWKGLTPESAFTDVGSSSWVCNLTFAQDWATTDSLSAYLFNNEGNAVECEFAPVAGGPRFSATIVITPGSIGGAIDSVAVGTVSLGVQGRPVIIPVVV
jgi:hypothetical protein